jgi:hypothetical protein
MNEILEIDGITIASVIVPNPSNLKEIQEEIKRLEQEQEENYRQEIIDYRARLRELDELEQETKRDKIYDGDLKEKIEQARKVVLDGYNKLFAMQNQADIEVGIDALEVGDFYNIDTKSNSAVIVSTNDQPGTSRTQNVAACSK